MKHRINYKYTLSLILILALVLRLVIINQSLWLDEAIGALAVRDFSIFGIVTNFIKFDNHPPLYYLILKLWTTLFGYSEISLRTPSIIFGLGTICLTYKIYYHLKKNKISSLKMSFLLATSQLHVYYSQEARMYSLSTFLVSVSVYYFLKITKEKKVVDWFIFSIINTMIFFTDYLPILIITVYFTYALFNKKNWYWWKSFLLSFIPLIIGFFIWFPVFKMQSESGNWLLKTVPKWAEIAGGANIKQTALLWVKFVFGRITLINKSTYFFLTALFSIPFACIILSSLKKNLKTNIYLYWIITPLIMVFIISLYIPAFIYFRFLFILPAFYGLLVSGIENINKVALKRLAYSAVLITNIISLGIYYFNPINHRENWSRAAGMIDENLKPNEVALFSYPEPFAPYRWYAKNNMSYGSTDSILASSGSISITKNLINNKSGIYYFEYLSELSDPEKHVHKTLLAEGYVQESVYNFNGVGLVYYYTRH